MSTKKTAKSKAAPKRTRTAPAKPKSVVQGHDAAPEPIRGRWTQSIDPPEIAVIAHKIWGLFVAIGNRGPSTVLACTGRDEEKITPNALRVILIQGELTIESMDGKCATVELEFIPRAI
jgi:hypothetical protein